jgi:hypothetical protein
MRILILTLALSITSISGFSAETKHNTEECLNASRLAGKALKATKSVKEVKAASVTKD